MKLLSEFPAHILAKGETAKEALAAEGKSEEEIATSLGETFKLKENRLKYFIPAINVAKESTLEKLFRIRIYMFDENDKIPEGAVQVEEAYFVPEVNPAKPGKPPTAKKAGDKGGRGKKDRPKGPKPSPWGESPEEIALKKAASKKAAEAKANS